MGTAVFVGSVKESRKRVKKRRKEERKRRTWRSRSGADNPNFQHALQCEQPGKR